MLLVFSERSEASSSRRLPSDSSLFSRNASSSSGRRAGRAGLEETYAESASRFYGNDLGLAASWPNLRAFWNSAPLEAVEVPLAKLPPQTRAGPVGTARIGDKRTIFLDLRAEGPGGAIGHAALEFPVSDPVHERLASHLAKQGEDVGGEALFFPMSD